MSERELAAWTRARTVFNLLGIFQPITRRQIRELFPRFGIVIPNRDLDRVLTATQNNGFFITEDGGKVYRWRVVL